MRLPAEPQGMLGEMSPSMPWGGGDGEAAGSVVLAVKPPLRRAAQRGMKLRVSDGNVINRNLMDRDGVQGVHGCQRA
ncbi:hypothetical protein NHX12_032355 [Muraenolepis orangiensis]|uniref:Uncharacterized protein n=1 Tax=Muraenolepis orangiensis TaxID=630683 RepID=A0A9Q0E702_9TELE|nr:hypothetical protein NHX12_032355 [Muraenolepis orangiensis]